MAQASGTERREFSEAASSLWLITIAPSLWALHFVIVYAGAAVLCAKTEGWVIGFAELRIAIGVVTVVALAGICFVGWRSWRQWDYRHLGEYSHGEASNEHRHSFLGHAAFLLATMSAIGVLYTALPALLIGDCS
ncbi:hypothetical protein ACKTEK_00085 [Tepidamorphus sp. 3E244]|uniref:hypothetical protein n=1 Tax=Tepidamorphus sp. 3E244 TaxID=3385498 RepID=UPI0038FCF012